MKKQFPLYVLTLLAIIIIGCSSSDNDPNDQAFNVEALLSDITNQNILPSVGNFVTQSSHLSTVIDTYATTPNESNLTACRNQWKSMVLAYEAIYIYNIGDVRDQFLHQAIYIWPTVTGAIEDFIANNEATESFINGLSPQVKSIAALEYLLFKSDLSNTNTEFANDANRRAYLKLAALNLKGQAERIQTIWSTTGDNYAAEFINNSGSGIQGSFNRLYNGIHNLIDTGKVTKIGKPAGLENSQVLSPDLTQAYFSHSSLDILKMNMNSVEAAYFNPNGLGIDDYVSSVTDTDELNTAVQTKINEVNAAIDAIPGTLFDAITQHHDLIETLHTKLEELKILFAVDIRSTLSIIITSTDNDGD